MISGIHIQTGAQLGPGAASKPAAATTAPGYPGQTLSALSTENLAAALRLLEQTSAVQVGTTQSSLSSLLGRGQALLAATGEHSISRVPLRVVVHSSHRSISQLALWQPTETVERHLWQTLKRSRLASIAGVQEGIVSTISHFAVYDRVIAAAEALFPNTAPTSSSAASTYSPTPHSLPGMTLSGSSVQGQANATTTKNLGTAPRRIPHEKLRDPSQDTPSKPRTRKQGLLRRFLAWLGSRRNERS